MDVETYVQRKFRSADFDDLLEFNERVDYRL